MMNTEATGRHAAHNNTETSEAPPRRSSSVPCRQALRSRRRVHSEITVSHDDDWAVCVVPGTIVRMSSSVDSE
jgi:hypothetical protein